MPSSRIDFEELKQRISIADVVEMLDLQTVEKNGNLRAECPRCQSGGKRVLSITPAEGVFQCFASEKGGTILDLVMHVRNVPLREAGRILHEHFIASETAYTARSEAQTADPPSAASRHGKHAPETLSEVQPLLEKVKARLDHSHEILGFMGFPEIVWRRLGIGFDPRTKRVMFPLYKDGQKVGYAGLATSEDQTPLMLLHQNLVTICAGGEQHEQQARPKGDAKSFFRVVK